MVILICVPLVLTPQYAQLVEEYGLDLPWLTELLISLSDSARRYGFLYFPLAAVGVLVWELVLLFLVLLFVLAFALLFAFFLAVTLTVFPLVVARSAGQLVT